MKSVRLDGRLESRLRRAARLAGISESELIRQGVVQRTDQILAGELDPEWQGIVGAIRSGGGRAENASRVFTDLLGNKRRSRPRSRS